jgi:hypothetical protein
MKKRLFVGLILIATFLARARAAVSPNTVPLKLTNGKTYEQWVIMSETASSVFIKFKGGAAKIAKDLLPPELLALHPIDPEGVKLEAAASVAFEEAKKARKAESDAQALRAQHDLKDLIAAAASAELALALAREDLTGAQSRVAIAQSRAAEARMNLDRARGTRPAATPALTPAVPTAAERFAVVTKLAKAHAENFFKYEFRAGSADLLVVESNVVIEEVVDKPGWTDEYSVKGKGMLQFYESAPSRTYRRESRAFTLELKLEGGTGKVSNFALK